MPRLLLLAALGCVRTTEPVARLARFEGDAADREVLVAWTVDLRCTMPAGLPPVLDLRLDGCQRIGDGLRLLEGDEGRYHLDASNSPAFPAFAACVGDASDERPLDVWALLGGTGAGCGRGVVVPASLPVPDEVQIGVHGLSVTADGIGAHLTVALRRRR